MTLSLPAETRNRPSIAYITHVTALLCPYQTSILSNTSLPLSPVDLQCCLELSVLQIPDLDRMVLTAAREFRFCWMKHDTHDDRPIPTVHSCGIKSENRLVSPECVCPETALDIMHGHTAIGTSKGHYAATRIHHHVADRCRMGLRRFLLEECKAKG